MGTIPLKPPTTLEQQIERLRKRGMSIEDDIAQQWLSNISYYRLSAYWYPNRIIIKNSDGQICRGDLFIPRTSFEDVIALYEADRKLRTLIHDGIERIEVALRARIGELLVSEGSLSYRNKIIFRPNFKHEEWLETADKRVSRAMRRNESIKHYADQYGGQYPFWVLADVLDFSDISKLYEGLKTTDQYKLAEDLGVNIDLNLLSANLRRKTLRSHPLVRWFEQLSIVRNTCAHHGRLWNKSFTPASTNALRTVHGLSTLPDGQSGRIYGTLVLMAFLLQTISPNSSWQGKIINLLEDLQVQLKISYLFVAHDLAVIRHISDTVAVMHLGKIVEYGETEEVFTNPQDPYTKALLSAIPIPDPKIERTRERMIYQDGKLVPATHISNE